MAALSACQNPEKPLAPGQLHFTRKAEILSWEQLRSLLNPLYGCGTSKKLSSVQRHATSSLLRVSTQSQC